MKIFLILSLLICAIGQVSAQISEDILKQGWYVLPWEIIREYNPEGDVTLEDIKQIATVENLVQIKQKLPKRIKEVSVTTALQRVINRYDKKEQLSVIQEDKIGTNTNLPAALDAQIKYLKFKYLKFHSGKKKSQNFKAQDIYFIFLKNKNSDEIEVHITTRIFLNLKINEKCCCCCGMGCLIAGAGVCAAVGYACVQFLM